MPFWHDYFYWPGFLNTKPACAKVIELLTQFAYANSFGRSFIWTKMYKTAESSNWQILNFKCNAFYRFDSTYLRKNIMSCNICILDLGAMPLTDLLCIMLIRVIVGWILGWQKNTMNWRHNYVTLTSIC